MIEIGRLKRLRRYPVKSMRGEDLREVFVSQTGLRGDRVHAFVDPANKSNFPWVSARQVPELLLFEPRFEEGAPTVKVRSPEGVEHQLPDAAFVRELEKRWGRPLLLRSSPESLHDSSPISIFGLASLRALENETSLTLDPCRFRANFYVEWSDPAPFYEETLVGRTIQIGAQLKVRIDKKDARCVIINLDPASALASPNVLKTVGQKHQGRIGVYALTVQTGPAALEDPIFLTDGPPA